MEFELTSEGTRLTVMLAGELNTMTASELEAALLGAFASVNDIVIDMGELTYITSAGLRILLICQYEVEERGGVTIRGANPVIREIISVAGFDSIMTLE